MLPTARTLILGLLLASGDEAVSVRDFVIAAALFDIRENNVRVALVRLSGEGLIEAEGRGSYRLTATAHDFAVEVATWRDAESRVRPWHGSYLVVHSGHLGRSNRGALRRRQRALQMLGFGELERDLHVRPDNLDGGPDVVRRRLYTLGLESTANVFVAADFDAKRTASIRDLWDSKALNARYRKQRTQLEAWMAKADTLEDDVAARESFLLGRKAIRDVVFDPLLPAPFVDIDARRAFFRTVARFDQCGQAIWRRSHRLQLPADAAPPGTHLSH